MIREAEELKLDGKKKVEEDLQSLEVENGRKIQNIKMIKVAHVKRNSS